MPIIGRNAITVHSRPGAGSERLLAGFSGREKAIIDHKSIIVHSPPDGAIGRGLLWPPGEPIEYGQPRQRQEVIGPVEAQRQRSMAAPYHAIMTLDLTDDETAALARLLHRTIDDDRYPLTPRLAPLEAILAKLDPPKPRPEVPPSLKAVEGTVIRNETFLRLCAPHFVSICGREAFHETDELLLMSFQFGSPQPNSTTAMGPFNFKTIRKHRILLKQRFI